MKLAFSTNAFKSYSLEDAVKEIASVGYGGVELLCDVPHAYPPDMDGAKIQSVRKTISDCKMEISNLNAFTLYAIGDVYHPSWIEEGQEARESRIAHTINCIRMARLIGARNISTEPGGPYDANGGRDRLQLEKIFARGLARAAKIAEEEGIMILVEPEPQLLLENSTQFKQLMKEVDSEYVRLNFDIGHFFCVREDPAKTVHELADHIGHFHLADINENRVHNHLIPGHGAINFGQVFEAIDDIGYKGFVTVESYPYQSAPTKAAQEAFDYLTGIMR